MRWLLNQDQQDSTKGTVLTRQPRLSPQINMKIIPLLITAGICLSAQPWSGILDASRAYDWTSGVGFSIPAYATPCATQPSLSTGISSASANASAINAAIASCDATHNVVSIASGTWYVEDITYGGKSNVVVRGAGPNSTAMFMTGSIGCGGYVGVPICMAGGALYAQSASAAPGSGNTVCSWTGGYSQGATSITLDSCNSAPTNGSILVLDQGDDGSDNGGIWLCSSYDTTPSPRCSQNGPNQNAAGRLLTGTGAYCSSTPCIQYSEAEETVITAVSGSGPYTVTISPGIYFNNIRSGQNPGAWWSATQITHDGLENLTVDHDDLLATVNTSGTAVTATSGSAFTSGMILSGGGGATNNGYIFINGVLYTVSAFTDATHITLVTSAGTQTGVSAAWSDGAASFGGLTIWCLECWVKNVRSINGMENHWDIISSVRPVIRDNYFFANQHSGSESYCVQMLEVSGALVQNNIMQNTTSPDIKDAVTGSVVAYNFTPKITFSGYLQGVYASHNSGSEFNLLEGNSTTEFLGDDVWGTSHLITIFRNQAVGWQPGFTNQTFAFSLNSGVRAVNLIGNVLGQPSYHTQYQAYATSTTAGVHTLTATGGTTAGSGTVNQSIYELGWSDTGGLGVCTTPPVCDPLTFSTLMRWGNYDTVQNSVTWNSTESSPAAVTYVNANSTPSSHTLPASFYLSSKPSWFGSIAWPPIGPDVTSGSVGICTSGTYSGIEAISSGQCGGGSFTASAWGGFANSNPAQTCYLNTMGGPPDGSGSALAFDANTCYAASPPTGTTLSGPGIKAGSVTSH